MIRVKQLHRSLFLRAGVLFACAAALPLTRAPAGTLTLPTRPQPGRFVLDSAGTNIGFEADASLGRFEGRATRFSGWAEVGDTLNFAGARGHVEIEVASFRTGNGMRDGHLRGDMQADRHPQILFEAMDVQLAEVATVDSLLAGVVAFSDAIPALRVFVDGQLTVRDSTRVVRIPARVRMAGDTIRVRGRLATRFTTLGMKPPSRILGTVKVKDDIVLLFDALFRRSS